MANAKKVELPDGSPAVRIECNYERANCEREAAKYCDGPFVTLNKGDRSSEYNPIHRASDPSPLTGGVYKGVLYIRCR
jgi:hypothetical protein